MLPLIVDEEKVFIFKFWLNGDVQDGMCYRNELFRRLQTFELSYRPQAYHLACKLARKQSLIVLTSASATCSLWISLRDNAFEEALTQAESLSLPSFNLSTSPETVEPFPENN